MAATRTIVAVAIGNSQKNTVIRDSSPATLKGLRPYIKGLISWLANEPDPPVPDSVLGRYQIGDANDYVIDYRECTEDDLKHNYDFKPKNGLPSSYVILCMSTTVAREAVNFSTAIPIVAIVSDPFKENFPENVCGVSARRHDHAKDCYNIFKAKIAPTKIYLLHKDGYGPSEISRKWIGKRDCLSIKNNDVLKDKIGTIPRAQACSSCPRTGSSELPTTSSSGPRSTTTYRHSGRSRTGSKPAVHSAVTDFRKRPAVNTWPNESLRSGRRMAIFPTRRSCESMTSGWTGRNTGRLQNR